MRKKSNTKIAKTYAVALYDASVEKGIVKTVFSDVLKLLAVLNENADFVSYMVSPLWEAKDKKEVLEKTAKILKLDKETLNCLEIVLENGRAAELDLILGGFVKVYYQKNNVAEVEVETVKKLSQAQDKRLVNVLQKMFDKEVVVNYAINPDLLGGLRIKYGSKMFDDSLSNKLNYLENVINI